MENIIITEDLKFHYEAQSEKETPKDVLKGINLQIEKGSFVAVLGRNGCGKSTFAKHINAILVPTLGTIKVNGYDTSIEDNILNVRQSAGMVFQNPDNQIVATIVEDDVAFAPENLGVDPKEIRERVDDALKSVGMYEYRMHSPSQLSGGQKQRVAIAGIIAMRPKCIVLDEPTAMLDPMGRKEVMSTILKLKKDYGITVVLITHYMEEAVQADRVIVMDKGRVILDGDPHTVFSKVDTLFDAGLDVPQVTEFIDRLRKEGIDTENGSIISEDECFEELKKILA